MSRRAVAALFLSQLIAAVAFAQSAIAPATSSDASLSSAAEFGRVNGGDLEVITKHSRQFSGSLGMSMSRSSMPFGSNSMLKGYDATVGGTAVQDRVWFFAAAHQNESIASRFGVAPVAGMPAADLSRGIDAKLNAILSDRQNLSATVATGREPVTYNGMTLSAPLPTSFLSLHYTGVLSSNSFFTANVSRSTSAQPQLLPIVR